MSSFNQALLEKWLWQFGVDKEYFWRCVISVKYRETWGQWRCLRDRMEMVCGRLIRGGWNTFSKYKKFVIRMALMFIVGLIHGVGLLSKRFLS